MLSLLREIPYVAEEDDQLVGCIFVTTEKYERTQHEAIITLGVTKFYQKGIGLALINAVEAWALNHNIKRLQASVVLKIHTHSCYLKALDLILKANLK